LAERERYRSAHGAPLPERDRDSEFRTTTLTGEEILAFVDSMSADCRALLDTDAPFDPGASRATHRRPTLDAPDPHTESAAWALVHALEHLSEHVGHAQLTRQLWERRPD